LLAIPGFDAAGIVRAVEANVSDLHAGDHAVVHTGTSGGYATDVRVPRSQAVPYAAHLDPAAVSLMLNYLTALQMLTRSAHPADGTTILVHSAAGGVGGALLELGALRWMRMSGTASAAKASFVDALGATAIDFHAGGVARRVREQHPPASTPSSTHSAGGDGRKTCRCCVPRDSWSSTALPKAQERPAQPVGTPERHPWALQRRATSATSPKGVGITGLAGP
jgi:D-arabinose 1-dehydrogenase-like Zn-dependent alcohol dehydrogenase